MVAPAAMFTAFAVGCPITEGPPLERAKVVPIATEPPPAGPDALTLAVGASATVPVAFTTTEPPVVPGARPFAATVPTTTTSPPAPEISTRPVCPGTLSAAVVPPAFTRVCTTPSTACAVSKTVPPDAVITPVLVTSAAPPSGAVATCLVTLMDTIPSP